MEYRSIALVALFTSLFEGPDQVGMGAVAPGHEGMRSSKAAICVRITAGPRSADQGGQFTERY